MPQIRRFSQLSQARQVLVRLCQVVNFGEIQGIDVRNADPIFDPASVVVFDARLDKEELPRSEVHLADFELRGEVCRLLFFLDELKDGTIQRLEVRAGAPHRLVFESRISKILGAKLACDGNEQQTVD